MVKMAQKKQGQRTHGLGAAHFTGAHTPLRTRTMVGGGGQRVKTKRVGRESREGCANRKAQAGEAIGVSYD